MATHRKIYNELKHIASEHLRLSGLLGEIENEKFEFEFGETDSDRIIDTLIYGIDDLKYDEYLKEMKFYAKSFKENEGDIKANGDYGV